MTAASGLDEPDVPIGTETGRRTLYRSRTNRTFAGVCGGVAEYFGSDATAVRLLTVIVTVLTGIFPMLIIYLAAAIIVPERIDGAAPATSRGVHVAPGQGGLIVGVLLVGVGVMALANRILNVEWDLLWPVALVVLGGAIVLAATRRD